MTAIHSLGSRFEVTIVLVFWCLSTISPLYSEQFRTQTQIRASAHVEL
jgi:hypothetical protein